MSGENLAGVGLRITQLASAGSNSGNDLAGLNVKELPNGALAFTNDTKTLWYLDKFSALTAGAAVLAAFGGGRWIALYSALETNFSTMVQWTVVAGSAVTTVQNTWAALPSSANNFSQVAAASGSVWSASTTSGVLTYSGPTRSFLVQAQMTAFATTGTTTNLGFGFSRSDAAIIGGTTNPLYESQQECAAQEGRTWSIVGVVGDLVAAQTLQGCVRNIDGTETITVQRYTMVVTPLP